MKISAFFFKKRTYTHARAPLPLFVLFTFQWPPLLPSSTNVLFEWPHSGFLFGSPCFPCWCLPFSSLEVPRGTASVIWDIIALRQGKQAEESKTQNCTQKCLRNYHQPQCKLWFHIVYEVAGSLPTHTTVVIII